VFALLAQSAYKDRKATKSLYSDVVSAILEYIDIDIVSKRKKLTATHHS